ncbi:hypothetical protein FSP39_000113 [Pinctada imbricata]|uniref:Uncharacterized protein n=1 Tax=Pinctada imbricata TaxID=66713 RepID=A0AA88YQB8_PINIB|nr:hypothetical protein FSP39_000113 [Pinctada imbricata]
MRPKRYKLYELLFNFVLLTLFFLFYANGCILLLNGWTPISIYERTSLADVVISGHVIETYKEIRTSAMTYSAKFEVHRIYKGMDIVRSVTPVGKEVFIISNFGDKKLCYADVTSGERYILFLTEYQGRLSAQYDDIFGAAVSFTKQNEDEVVKQIGWKQWTTWGPCSHTCAGGVQTRRRVCGKKNETCSGDDIERRQCNIFSCNRVKNLLEIFGAQKLPTGVSRDLNRPTAFNITSAASLYTPLTNIYPGVFPNDFSIIFTVNISALRAGYLLTMSDIMGRQRLALMYGKKLRFEYYDQNDLPGGKSPLFDVVVSDSTWHQVAISVRNREISLYFDCENAQTLEFRRSKNSYFSTNLMLSLGPYFARYGAPFQGQIEQLFVIADPKAAAEQCHIQNTVPEHAIKDDGRVVPDYGQKVSSAPEKGDIKLVTDSKVIQKTSPTPPLVQWSSWSPCSATCGKGTQSRSLYCNNNKVEKCSVNTDLGSQSRLCYLTECKDDMCKNGGQYSMLYQRCQCTAGFTGKYCEKYRCDPICLNGGNCTGPNVCTCPTGYSGKSCNTAICRPKCRNGGLCARPDVCTCPQGYLPPYCKPKCSAVCKNGGRCIRRNRCKCKRGYTGSDCTTPVCRRGCSNGGTCVAPNRCSCPRGFKGRRCHKAICRPKCRNDGSCAYPNICTCRNGFFGLQCEKYKCKRTCKNGGFCIGPNKCACKPGYHGKWCHLGHCKQSCLNGGKCRNNRCRCRNGFKGKRSCRYEKYVQPYDRSYRKLIREDYVTKCGPWTWKTCVKTRVRYEFVSKTMYRTAYRCV